MRRTRASVTIADVASKAGVGAGTVSRVLNGGQVSGRARARVLAAIGDLDYRPRASARSLVTGATGTLALVIPFFTHPAAVERMRGALTAVDGTEYELVVCNVASPARRNEYTPTTSPAACSPRVTWSSSDTQALGVLEAAEFEGFAVPEDLSVVGFDDLEVAPYVGLTTVHQPLEESGRRGVERLIAALQEEDAQPHEERLELRLVVRRTTAPPRS